MTSANGSAGSVTTAPTVEAPVMPGPLVPAQFPEPHTPEPHTPEPQSPEPAAATEVAEEEADADVPDAAPAPPVPAPLAPPDAEPVARDVVPQVLPRPVPPPARSRRLRLPALPRPGVVLPLVAVAALAAGLAASTAGTADRADRVESALAQGTAAAGRVSAIGAPVDPEKVRADLLDVVRYDRAVQAERGGATWTLSRWSTMPGRIDRLDRRATGLSLLAEAGRPLGAALVAATGGEPDPARLAALAGTAQVYADAARESGLVPEAGLRPFTQVARLLPELAGGTAPRRWTVCTAAAGPCELLNVTEGRITSRRDLPGGPPALRVPAADTQKQDADGARAVPAGDVALVGPGADGVAGAAHLRVGALVDVLLRSTTATPVADRVTVRTAVPLVTP